MAAEFTGKIYWVEDDFAYSNSTIDLKPVKREYYTHSVAEIGSAFLDDNMIKIMIPDLDQLGYRVNLNREPTGLLYKGNFFVEHGDDVGDVSCQVFQSEKKGHYMLYGQWNQNERIYTWWAIISPKTPM
jgi:hypothetical protein